VGAEGSFSFVDHEWEWDASFAKAETVADQRYLPTIYNLERFGLARDAVLDASGNPVCRSTLTDPGNGCVPLNVLGVGVADPAAWDYVSGGPERRETYGLDVAAINFRVNDIGGWAGPISLAFGGEWREHSISGKVEEQWRSGWRFGNFQEDNGKYTVKEVYSEALIPLASGLDFNAGYRYADYSLSGGIDVWKLGLIEKVPFCRLINSSVQMRSIKAIINPGQIFIEGRIFIVQFFENDISFF
jgi:outer membrane receptor protein involved in Fe transport